MTVRQPMNDNVLYHSLFQLLRRCTRKSAIISLHADDNVPAPAIRFPRSPFLASFRIAESSQCSCDATNLSPNELQNQEGDLVSRALSDGQAR
jgi:hypothetical protein